MPIKHCHKYHKYVFCFHFPIQSKGILYLNLGLLVCWWYGESVTLFFNDVCVTNKLTPTPETHKRTFLLLNNLKPTTVFSIIFSYAYCPIICPGFEEYFRDYVVKFVYTSAICIRKYMSHYMHQNLHHLGDIARSGPSLGPAFAFESLVRTRVVFGSVSCLPTSIWLYSTTTTFFYVIS